MNPELRRNLWLELTPHRLIAAPVVLLLVLLLVSSRDERPWPAVYATASVILVLLVHFWGTRKAAEAVTEEVRERTWDWQRLSSLGPWSMAWGKLAGAAAFPWYGALLCIVAMAAAAAMDRMPQPVPWTIAGLVASGIALHGAALAASIQASRKDSRLGARIGTLFLIPIALVAAMTWLRGMPRTAPDVHWGGASVALGTFVALSCVVFAAWAVLGAHREMQRELKVRALPWAWPAFALFAGAYVAGFDELSRVGRGTAFVYATFIAALVLFYYGLFADVTTAMGLRRVALHARAGDWRRAFEELPLWATIVPLLGAFAVLATLQPWPEAWRLPRRSLGAIPVAIFLVAARDALLLAFFALGRRARRVEGATVLYLVLLNGVLPALSTAMGLDALASALLPWQLPGWQAVAVAALHVAVAGSAVAVRWRRMERALGG